MSEMLANRYLLNGRAARALGLYERALEQNPGQRELRCRLILSYLVLERVEQAARLVLETLEAGGTRALAELAAGCQGFVPPGGQEEPAAVGALRALLHGDFPRARRLLAGLEAGVLPVLDRLARHLEASDEP
jgi:tetratricopeptide (TPR) repeat protein